MNELEKGQSQNGSEETLVQFLTLKMRKLRLRESVWVKATHQVRQDKLEPRPHAHCSLHQTLPLLSPEERKYGSSPARLVTVGHCKLISSQLPIRTHSSGKQLSGVALCQAPLPSMTFPVSPTLRDQVGNHFSPFLLNSCITQNYVTELVRNVKNVHK